MRYPSAIDNGAVAGVTGSCHQLLVDGDHSLLVDCGLFQGAQTSPEGRAETNEHAIDCPLDGIKALIATHVHIDHGGRIPYLLAACFNGPIICSEPSSRLLSIVLEDACKLGVNRLSHTAQPAIVIAGNGMCSSGRIVNYLKAMLGDARHESSSSLIRLKAPQVGKFSNSVRVVAIW